MSDIIGNIDTELSISIIIVAHVIYNEYLPFLMYIRH